MDRGYCYLADVTRCHTQGEGRQTCATGGYDHGRRRGATRIYEEVGRREARLAELGAKKVTRPALGALPVDQRAGDSALPRCGARVKVATTGRRYPVDPGHDP